MVAPAAQVSNRMAKLTREVSRAQTVATSRAGMQAKTLHLRDLAVASGGDLRLSGVGKKGARVGARWVRQDSGGVKVIPAGPVHLVEKPSKAHEITPRFPRRRRASAGARALAAPGFGPVSRVRHPGVRNPSRPWSKAMVKVRPAVKRIIERQYGEAFARGMR